MKKLLVLLLALGLFAAACGDDDSSDDADDAATDAGDAGTDAGDDAGDDTTDTGGTEGDTTDDDTADGETVERIVSLSPTATEILFAIGAGDQVVAVDQFSNYPEEAPITDLDGFTVNVESVAAYEPQLVTMQVSEATAELEALGISVIARDAPADFDGIYTQIEELGAATGHIAEAAELVLQIQTRIEELTADAPDGEGMTYYHELGTDYYSVNQDSFVAQVYSLFGLTSIGDQADGEAFNGYLPLSEEFILGADPDVIFLADTIWAEQTADTVAARPGWADLTAVQNGAVVELDDDVASRWGPRVVEFAEAIAGVLATVGAPA
jgi:iron complex transport system substrate-binding protein